MLKKILVGVASLFVAGSAFAVAPTTVAELTTAISFADVGLGILAVAGLLITLYVTVKAAKMIMHFVRGN